MLDPIAQDYWSKAVRTSGKYTKLAAHAHKLAFAVFLGVLIASLVVWATLGEAWFRELLFSLVLVWFFGSILILCAAALLTIWEKTRPAAGILFTILYMSIISFLTPVACDAILSNWTGVMIWYLAPFTIAYTFTIPVCGIICNVVSGNLIGAQTMIVALVIAYAALIKGRNIMRDLDKKAAEATKCEPPIVSSSTPV